ncbi:hypothetical protein GPECTOR_6g809 [Gonium pectorale]|uniref:Uncharacterized protein n=1 Tax=Gonium pectorale TaxID=33097 RepID=A0A150GVM6_GONPE|nr:hypothetical protein GPECTOR_6g809 [Gonium pectorale]|eukprot:KXZ53891.1 hypothetical protein GPECTOR_6g809 [Gonium pectorale]
MPAPPPFLVAGRWDVAGPEPVLETSFDGHADWVNDLALIGDLLITASNDQTVRLWKAGSDNGQHLHTLSYHSDYVTCLAAAPSRGAVVSAGLRSEIFLLNIESGKHTQLYPRTNPPPGPAPGPASAGSPVAGSASGLAGGASGVDDGPYSGGGSGGPPLSGLSASAGGGGGAKAAPGSVYALALNSSASVVAAGTSEALIRLLDPRSGKKIAKLRGHQDTVRALLVNSDGTTLLSGASDGSIKLWDVGMQRCVQTTPPYPPSENRPSQPPSPPSPTRPPPPPSPTTYTVHSDSVWSLLSPDDSFSVIYSAGRDRALYRTHTHSRTTELLAVEDGPVTAMALDSDVGAAGPGGGGAPGLWVATPASHVNLWVLPREAPGGAGTGGDGGRSFSVARRSLGATANRNRMSLEANRQPLARTPAAVVPGIPGIVAHEVLADRRRVLTADARGHVALWDVLTGTRIAAYGKWPRTL